MSGQRLWRLLIGWCRSSLGVVCTPPSLAGINWISVHSDRGSGEVQDLTRSEGKDRPETTSFSVLETDGPVGTGWDQCFEGRVDVAEKGHSRFVDAAVTASQECRLASYPLEERDILDDYASRHTVVLLDTIKASHMMMTYPLGHIADMSQGECHPQHSLCCPGH